MTWTIDRFRRMGIYEEKSTESDIEVNSGRVIKHLPDKIKEQLNSIGGDSYGGDYSKQDIAIITSMMSHHISPDDVYATFSASLRGKHARERKQGHFHDYLTRTIRKASGFIGSLNTSNKIDLDFSRTRKTPEGEGIISVKAHEVEVETPRWVWPLYIPAGKLTIIAGDPGIGKSTVALDIVSRISRGTFLPIGGRTPAGNSLVASAEDAPEDTTVPRLIACQANLRRIEIMREVKIDEEVKYISFPRDLNRLRDAIVRTGARMVIVDPLNAFLGKDTDSYKDQDIRLVLAPFEGIAEETGAAVVIIAHLNKREESSMIYRIGGSIGIVGAARSVLMVSSVPNKDTKVLYSVKSNLGKRPPALEYRTKTIKKQRKKDSDWAGEEKIVSSTIEWIGEIDFDPATGIQMTKDKADETAEEFLRQVISDCEVNTDTIYREAKSAGISRALLFRVKDSLGVKSIKKKDGWYWKL